MSVSQKQITDTAAQTASVTPLSEGAERILTAAAELFAEQGYDGVSINAVAERAGVCKANVFHHFRSKDALYLAVLRTACAQTRELLDHMVISTGPITERLKNFAKHHLLSIMDHDGITRLILRELMQDGERHSRQLAEQVYGDSFSKLVELLRQAQWQGELRSDIDPAMAATILIGANVFFFEARSVLRYFPDIQFAHQPEQYAECMTDMLLRGIGVIQ